MKERERLETSKRSFQIYTFLCLSCACLHCHYLVHSTNFAECHATVRDVCSQQTTPAHIKAPTFSFDPPIPSLPSTTITGGCGMGTWRNPWVVLGRRRCESEAGGYITTCFEHRLNTFEQVFNQCSLFLNSSVVLRLYIKLAVDLVHSSIKNISSMINHIAAFKIVD